MQGSRGHDDYCLVFMHIPKTAGTTLASSLQWNYPPRQTIHVDLLGHVQDMEKVPLELRSRARLVHGHIPYGIHKYIPRQCEYVTILREPVDRVISAYKYVLRRPTHRLHDQVVGANIGLEEFVERFWVDEHISRQTRALIDRHNGSLDREALEVAKRNLEGFLLVGLTERFEETFVLLRRDLRLRLPFYATRNVAAPYDDVSERTVDLIREREQYDLEIYELARQLFAKQIAGQSSSFPLEVSVFRALRPLWRATGAGGTGEFLRKLSRARWAWNRAGAERPGQLRHKLSRARWAWNRARENRP
jgi:hypothetical protein